jgi:serine/threonine protein kinase
MADHGLAGRMLGQYILRELIGEGGYGAVYRGEQPALERDVVVKVLHERRSDSDSRERFLREAKLAAQLDHPYATHIYAFGAEDQGRLLWIAMERVRGVPLDAWLDRHGPMPPEQFGLFFEGLCEVIHAAHKQGIVHRDLKPSNIMVVECEGRPLPKLLDFGIAKWHRPPEVAPDAGSDEDQPPDRDAVKTERLPVRPRRAGRNVACYDSESRRQLTPPGGCLGSPPYMALEQWVGADAVGPEADIYALAIIAYEMLTARQLFVANQTADYLDQHKRASAPPLGDGFPPALDQVIQCALDLDPRARPATALELASDLRSALRKIKREQLRASAQQWADPRGRVRPDLQARARRRRRWGSRRPGCWPGSARRRARGAAERPGRTLRPELPPHRRSVAGRHRSGLGRDLAVPSLTSTSHASSEGSTRLTGSAQPPPTRVPQLARPQSPPPPLWLAAERCARGLATACAGPAPDKRHALDRHSATGGILWTAARLRPAARSAAGGTLGERRHDRPRTWGPGRRARGRAGHSRSASARDRTVYAKHLTPPLVVRHSGLVGD